MFNLFSRKEISDKTKDFMSWAEINLDHLEYNYNQMRKIVNGSTTILPIVKADAYGHGVIPVCKKLETLGVETVAVATLPEALHLAKSGLNLSILILLTGLTQQAETIVRHDFVQTIGNYQMAQALSIEAEKQNKTCRIHIKIDTGMNRLGFFPEEATEVIKKIIKLKNLKIDGIYTHFSSSFIEDKDYTILQWNKFNDVLQELEKNDIDISYKHISNSASIVDAAFIKLNMVRPGIMLYGLYPHDYLKNIVHLKPALSLKSKIISLKQINADSSVSYGRTHTSKKGALLAVAPIGYADGYSRRLSHNISVLIKGEFYPVVGNICMDQIIIDITNSKNIKIGDEVTLIGSDSGKTISVEEIAHKTNTINYEITCDINKRLPKVYIENGEITEIETIY